MSDVTEVTPSSSKLIDELTERVAAAKRKAWVATSLVTEFRQKLKQAEMESNAAERELDITTQVLAQAAIEAHDEVHGRPISDEDRHAFDIRWDANLEEIKSRRNTPPLAG